MEIDAAAATAPVVETAAAVPSERAPRARRRPRRLLLLVVAALALGEAAARLWDAGVGGTGSLYDHVVERDSRFVLTPAATVNVPERYGTVRYTFNRQGYRDRDHGRPTRPRLLLLGDSVTFGLGVPQDQIYSAVLQRELDASRQRCCEVVNQAVFAYHSGHELSTLREDGLPHRPRLVVVQFFMNDLAQPAAAARPAAAPPPTLGQRLAAARNRYLNRSAAWRRLRQGVTRTSYALLHDVRRTRFPETLNDAEPVHKLAYLEGQPEDEAIPALASILAMRDVAAARGARFLLLVTPDETQLFTARYDGINRRLASFCARSGVEMLDTLPLLRSAPRRERLFLDGVHLSPEGHQLVGRHLAAHVRSMGVAVRR
jgi:lysophospholipase L1-like esterase